MKEIKEKHKNLSINLFNCILDKLYDPSTSYAEYNAFRYIEAVNLWNNYVFNSKKNFDILISYENIVF